MSARIEEFREERGLNESEAGRRLLLRGLDAVDEIETADTPAEVDDATPDDAETTSFRQDSSRAERWLGSAVTLLVAGFVAAEAFAAPVLSDVAFLGGVAAVTYFMTTTVVRRLQAARASRAADTDETPAAEPAAGGE
jgi:hypothetical protein